MTIQINPKINIPAEVTGNRQVGAARVIVDELEMAVGMIERVMNNTEPFQVAIASLQYVARVCEDYGIIIPADRGFDYVHQELVDRFNTEQLVLKHEIEKAVNSEPTIGTLMSHLKDYCTILRTQ